MRLDLARFRSRSDGTEVQEVTLRGYRLERITERDASSLTVYEASVAATGERVQVRAFPLPEEPRLRRRVRRVAKKRVAIRHKNVLRARDAFEDGGHLYLVTEASDAPTLASRLERGPLEPQLAVWVLSQASEGLEAAHAAGVRDNLLSPAGILLDPSDRAILADIGSATALTELVQPWAHPHARYFSPELGQGEHTGPRTSVYSLACILFETLAGTPPYDGNWISLSDLHSAEPIPTVSERRPALGTAIDPVIARALAEDPGDRFASPRALMDAAAAALEGVEAETTRGVDARRRREAEASADREAEAEAELEAEAEAQRAAAAEAQAEREEAEREAEAEAEAEAEMEAEAQRAAAAEAHAECEEAEREAEAEAEREAEAEAEREAEAEAERGAQAEAETAEREADAAARREAAALRAAPVAAESAGDAAGGSAPPGDPRAGGGLRRAGQILAGCGVAAALALGGYLVGRASAPDSAPEKLTAGALSVELPSAWDRRPTAGVIPGVRLNTALAAGPRGSGDRGMLLGRTAGNGLLPPGLSTPAGMVAEPVRLGRFDAYRLRRARAAGGPREIVAYSVPTTDGAVVAACHAAPGVPRTFMRTCEGVASTLQLKGLRTVSPSVLAAEDRRLAGTLTELRTRRSADRLALSSAPTWPAQGRIAQRLQIAYGEARTSLERMSATRDSPRRRELVGAMTRVEEAYGALARATQGSSAEYDAARRAVDEAEAALGPLLARPPA